MSVAYTDSKDIDMKGGTNIEVRSASLDDREKGIHHDNVKIHDEVFGDIKEDGPNYRGVSLGHRWSQSAHQGTHRSHLTVQPREYKADS